jgi:hypothetical protein
MTSSVGPLIFIGFCSKSDQTAVLHSQLELQNETIDSNSCIAQFHSYFSSNIAYILACNETTWQYEGEWFICVEFYNLTKPGSGDMTVLTMRTTNWYASVA